ncbi:MAG TPA: GtrA family protein [Bacilli bacterium]
MKIIIKKFFTKSFIFFCIIGVINTLLHLLVYNFFLLLFEKDEIFNIFDSYQEVIANTIAFISASVFSYWANATITFKAKMNYTSFGLLMLVFIMRLILSDFLVLVFKYIFLQLDLDQFIKIIPIPVSCILIPLQFLAFNRILIPIKKYEN